MGFVNALKSLFIKADSSISSDSRGTTTTLNDFLRKGYPNLGDDYVQLSGDKAMTVSYVYAAVNGISSDIASFKWAPYEKEGNTRKVARDHDQYELQTNRAYFAYNSTTWRKAWIANYLLTGDGFSEIIRDERTGRPVGYRLWHKKEIDIVINHKEERLVYRIVPENYREVDYMDMLHLSDLSLDGLFGLSKIGMARKSLEIASRSDSTQNNIQKNGTYLGGYIKIDSVLDSDQLKKYRESFKDVYGGTSGEIAILDEGATFTPFSYSMTMADAEFITSRKFTGEEILRYFRYPAHMAGNLDRSTNNNIEQQALEYVNYTLRPIVIMMENEMNSKLFRKRDKGRYYIKGDLNSLLRGDIESRMKLYETLWKVGALSANDALALEDMNPVENGDLRYADLNKVPVNMVEEYYREKINGNAN